MPQKQSTADRLAQDCHWPPFPLHRPSVSHKREVFTVLCTLLSLALLFGQRHETQPLRFYRMRQGQRCGEGTRDAQEGTVSVSNPASLQEHLSSGDVWHRTQLLTILQDVRASIPTQIPSGIKKKKMPPQIDKTPGGLEGVPGPGWWVLCTSEAVD